MNSTSSRAALGATGLLLVLAPGASAQQHPAFTPNSDYDKTIFFTPNGTPEYVGPMALKMLGGGDSQQFGGGQYAKVGLSLNLEYTTMTEGEADDYNFYINRGPAERSLPLPPDVTSLNDLPPLVRLGPDMTYGTSDDLALSGNPNEVTLSRVPAFIAGLEWARYCNLPYSVNLFASLSDGGTTSPLWARYNLDNYFEGLGPYLGKSHCALDASGLCQPSDDPSVPQGTGAWVGNLISFATPSLADPDYEFYQLRNLRSAIRQVLAVGSDPRYAGRLVALGLDPEINIPGHMLNDPNWFLPSPHGGQVLRPFVCDYSSGMLDRFRQWLQQRYGDASPMTDSNADGRTFWGDFGPAGRFPNEYANQGWPAVTDSLWAPLADHLTTPTTWSLVDPPRVFPEKHTSPVTPYWHMWTDFRTEQVSERLELMISTMVLEGFPGNRIFTHQMLPSASMRSFRAEGPAPGTSAGTFVIDYCNDMGALNPSQAFGGINMYGVKGFTNWLNLIEQFRRRIDDWGSQEFQPYIQDYNDPPSWTSPAELTATLNLAWQTRAHVLWPHYWGLTTHAAFDASDFDGPAQLGNLSLWKPEDMTPNSSTADFIDWAISGTAPYLESLALNPALNTAQDSFIVLEAVPNPLVTNNPEHSVRIDFHDASGWHTGPVVKGRAFQGHTGILVCDMSTVAGWTANPTVDAIRIRPSLVPGELYGLARVTFARHNNLSTAIHELVVAKKDLPRPSLVTPYPIEDGILPFELGAGIADMDANSTTATYKNLVVFGTDPHNANQANETFDDWATNGNFAYVPSSSTNPVKCGNRAMNAIRAPAPTFLGLRKTGRYRRLHLPDVSDLYLSFTMGIEDVPYSSPPISPSVDGVRFRVVLRDEAGVNHKLLDRDWVPPAGVNRWSDAQYLSLDGYRGQTVDLLFETQGIGNATGDNSAWGAPRIERLKFFRSEGDASGTSRDGWIYASSQSGTFGSTTGHSNDGNGLKVGNLQPAGQTTSRAHRSIVSFDTSSLGNRKLMRGSLALCEGSLTGDPYGQLGSLLVDIRTGSFLASSLEAADYQEPASATAIGVLPKPAGVGEWTRADLSQTTMSFVNKSGLTQFRLRYSTSSSFTYPSAWIGFHSGETAQGSTYAPLLVVSYRDT